MKRWYSALEDRERRLVMVGGAALLVLVAVLLVWVPLNERRDALAQRAETQADTLVWMEEARQQVLSGRRQAETDAGDRDGRSLLSLIDATAREHELGERLRRAEPSGANGVRVWFEGVRFKALAGWMESLSERYGLAFEGFSIDRAGTGRVNARVTVNENAET